MINMSLFKLSFNRGDNQIIGPDDIIIYTTLKYFFMKVQVCLHLGKGAGNFIQPDPVRSAI